MAKLRLIAKMRKREKTQLEGHFATVPLAKDKFLRKKKGSFMNPQNCQHKSCTYVKSKEN